MEIEILKEEKNDIELKIDNLTIAEILRVYLNKQGIEFAAWRREHPAKPATFRIKSSGKTIKKAVAETVTEIKSDCNKILALLKNK